MAKNNIHKRRNTKTTPDKFIKHFCCSAHNHPSGWRWWSRKARRNIRRQEKEELRREEV